MDYKTFEAKLRQLYDGHHASEWHGVLCGLLCAGYPTSAQHWCQVLNELYDVDSQPAEELNISLEHMRKRTKSLLNDTELGFAIMLPGDDRPLQDRVDALSRWCESFLYGLSIGGVNAGTNLPENVTETLEDLAEISRADIEADEADAEGEDHFVEIVEYIRVAVILINDELNPIHPINNNLH